MIERMHLAILAEVSRQGSLTAAANQLCLTQSALSHSIRKLEERLGTPLWRRDGRQLIPTQAGEYLLRLAERLLPQLEHAEERMRQFSQGARGSLRIGMECEPCHRWLVQRIGPFLAHWPDVDIDVKRQFQFGGLGALFAFDIDVLVTPDPLHRPGLHFFPVFDYEQVLVVSQSHALSRRRFVHPRDLAHEVLLTYPVPPERLDIYSHFLTPAGIAPRRHRGVENTEILLHLVASGRGVSALPRWLVNEYAAALPLVAVRLGRTGIPKQIHLGVRESDLHIGYVQGFLDLARTEPPAQSSAEAPARSTPHLHTPTPLPPP